MASSPRLSFAQLFSFQVSYSNHADSRGYANQGAFGLIGFAQSLGKKKGEWKRAILEFDFVMETMFLQDKDWIVVSATFKTYRRTVSGSGGGDDDDPLLSIRFENEQWEIMAQNAEEKKAIAHLLECVAKNMSAEEASELGKKNGVIGVTPDLVGKHVRFVTSLVGARVQISRSRMEFEVLVPNTKDLTFSSPSSMEGFSSWVKVIEASTNGDSRVYSDESDGYDDGRHGNAGWGPRRPRRGGGESSRAKGGRNYDDDDEMQEDLRRGPGGGRRSRYGEENRRYHSAKDGTHLDNELGGQYTGRPRPRTEDSFGQSHNNDYGEPYSREAQSYQEAEVSLGYQLPNMQDAQRSYNNTTGQYQIYDSGSDQAPPASLKPIGRTSMGGSTSWSPSEEDKWERKQLKNVNMRRRSVPLQCLDSALAEMTTSIGNMAALQGGNMGVPAATYNNTQPPKTDMDESRNNYNAQYLDNPPPPQPQVGHLERVVEDQQEYFDQSGGNSAGPQHGKLPPLPYYNEQSGYPVSPKQVQAQLQSYPSGYSGATKEGQLQFPSYNEQSGYLATPKQAQLQAYNDPNSDLASPKQMPLQGNAQSLLATPVPRPYNPTTKSNYACQSDPRFNNTVADPNESGNFGPSPPSQQAAGSNKTVIATSAIDFNGGQLLLQINAHKKLPMARSDTKAYGAITGGPPSAPLQFGGTMEGASSAPPPFGGTMSGATGGALPAPGQYGAATGGGAPLAPQFGANARMPVGGSVRPQPPAQDQGARPYQG